MWWPLRRPQIVVVAGVVCRLADAEAEVGVGSSPSLAFGMPETAVGSARLGAVVRQVSDIQLALGVPSMIFELIIDFFLMSSAKPVQPLLGSSNA